MHLAQKHAHGLDPEGAQRFRENGKRKIRSLKAQGANLKDRDAL
ncbi:hypothetical protein [Mesorhizobium sp. WSM4884]|nr:hypothetical protein [Mesorhizobium sp. WSM4884]MDG4883709.1 hypothetical protein [Mesorhizobium sp. WSM4884]